MTTPSQEAELTTPQPPGLKHRLKRAALTLLLILFALHGLRRCRAGDAPVPENPRNPALLPAGAMLITSPLHGMLGDLYTSEGSLVTNRQVIARLWPADIDQAVVRAREAVAEARMDLQQARLQLESARLAAGRDEQRTRIRIQAMEEQHRTRIALQQEDIAEAEAELTRLQAAGHRGQDPERDRRIMQLTGRIDLLEADIERRKLLLSAFETAGPERPVDRRVHDLDTAVRIASDRLIRREQRLDEVLELRDASAVTVEAPAAGQIYRLNRREGNALQPTDPIAVLVARDSVSDRQR